MRALAGAIGKRSTLMLEVPTFNETVLPNFEMSAWQGVLVPTGTPQPVIDRLNAEFNKAVASTEVRAKLAAQGAEPLGGTAAEYATYIRNEIQRFARLAKEANARLE